jgi:hypothetical protein
LCRRAALGGAIAASSVACARIALDTGAPCVLASHHHRTPATKLTMLKPLNEPRRALVEPRADGAPRLVNRLTVEVIREEWRVVDRWWTEDPVNRRYFDVVLESGQNVVVFHDDEHGRWFSQRGA